MTLTLLLDKLEPHQLPLRREILAITLEEDPAFVEEELDKVLLADTEQTALWLLKNAPASIRLKIVEVCWKLVGNMPAVRLAIANDPDNAVRESFSLHQPHTPEEVRLLLSNSTPSICRNLLAYTNDGTPNPSNEQFVEVWNHALLVHKIVHGPWSHQLAARDLTKQQVLDYLKLVSELPVIPDLRALSGLSELMYYVVCTHGSFGDELQAGLLSKFEHTAAPIDLASLGPKTRAHLEQTEYGLILLPILDDLAAGVPLTFERYTQAQDMLEHVPGLIFPLVRQADNFPAHNLVCDSLEMFGKTGTWLAGIPEHWGSTLLDDLVPEFYPSKLSELQIIADACPNNYTVRKLAEAGGPGPVLGVLANSIRHTIDPVLLDFIPANQLDQGGAALGDAVWEAIEAARNKLSDVAFSYVVRRLRDWTGPLPELIELADSLYSR